MAKPSLPQGTRDFGPAVVRKRRFILNTIQTVFETYGFQPLETPAMENLETLTGKYGEEGDRLIFKILNNGLDNPGKEKQVRDDFEKLLQGKSSAGITERALKYDLTIPFARYVAMHHGQLTFPFKRYQIQPVWRADRPQKGRYREFYQCDADVVGSRSLLNEIDLVCIYHEVFKRLGLTGYSISLNHRKLLTALAAVCGMTDNLSAITIAIDKLDKIGLEKVKEELANRGLNTEQINSVERYLLISGSNDEKIEQLKALFGGNEMAKAGLEEIEYLLQFPVPSGYPALQLDCTLARGLDYYTGSIFEVKPPDSVKMGSIGGGGRYDDLTGLFGVPGIPGVGISFGVDRIYDVMEELSQFPEEVNTGTQVLFFNLGTNESKAAYALMQQLREKGMPAELYHEESKFDKQFKYAEKKNIPYIVIIGSKELEEGIATIKNLKTSTQTSIPQNELISFLF